MLPEIKGERLGEKRKSKGSSKKKRERKRVIRPLRAQVKRKRGFRWAASYVLNPRESVRRGKEETGEQGVQERKAWRVSSDYFGGRGALGRDRGKTGSPTSVKVKKCEVGRAETAEKIERRCKNYSSRTVMSEGGHWEHGG